MPGWWCSSGARTFGTRDDTAWTRKFDRVLVNDEEDVPEVDRFNAGQKLVFWAMALFIPVLLFTGLVIWEVYFGAFTPLVVQRGAVLIHSLRGARGDHRLDHACLRRNLGPRIDAGDDRRLCDARLGLAPSPQMAARSGRDRIPPGRSRALRGLRETG